MVVELGSAILVNGGFDKYHQLVMLVSTPVLKGGRYANWKYGGNGHTHG